MKIKERNEKERERMERTGKERIGKERKGNEYVLLIIYSLVMDIV